MRTTLIIHSESENKLRHLFIELNKKIDKSKTCILLNAKSYLPWEIEDLKSEIISYSEYAAYPTDKLPPASIVEMILKSKNGDVIVLNENFDADFIIEKDSFKNLSSIYCNKKELLQLNLDTKYQTLKWFFTDIFYQKSKINIISDDSSDNKRFEQKISSPLFNEKIIYIDGGLGDHVMALPLMEKVSEKVYVCCKYPFIYEHIPVKGTIHWTDELFGGYDRFVYQYGSANNSKTIIDAFFEVYGFERNRSDVLKYHGKKEPNPDIITDKKIVLICTSAAKIQNLDSNKDWRDVRWLKLVHELKKNYFVIQVGSKSDNQIPNVDLKFLDKPIPNLAKLIEDSSLWISVDTFFHHFASAIKPEVGYCLTPFYNDHAKHYGVTYIEKDCKKNFSDRKWWMDLQQPERKECMDLIQLKDVLNKIKI